MKTAIMQPYLFPYIGYFQLIRAADIFVVYDDAQFIKQGWINRNYILVNGQKCLFTLHLASASTYSPINQRIIGDNRLKLTKTIMAAYKRAPYYGEAFPLIEHVLNNPEPQLDKYLAYSLEKISRYLDIPSVFTAASGINIETKLKGKEKVIALCKALHAETYINAIGGRSLYDKDEFRGNRIDLYFVQTKAMKYRQYENEFVPNLSIIDVLMFNSREEVIEMLNGYELI